MQDLEFVLYSFDGSEVARLWKLHDPSVKCSSNCGSAWVLGSESFILRVFLWGWVVTMGGGDYRVYSACFFEGVCFRWWCVFGGFIFMGVFR